MSKKYLLLSEIKRPLHIVAVAFFICLFFQCKKSTDLGSSVIDESEKANLKKIDTFQVVSSSVLQDSIQVFGSNNQWLSLFSASPTQILGHYYNTEFGKVYSAITLQYKPQSFNSTEDFSNITVDSVILSLVNKGYYGYSNPIPIQVFEISEPLLFSNNYFSNHQTSVNSIVMGEQLYSPSNTFDSILVGGVKEPSQLRIKLHNSYGVKLIQNIHTGADFLNYVPGIVVKTDTSKNQFTGAGCMIYLDVLDKYSVISVYYKNQFSESKTLTFTSKDSCVYFSSFKRNTTGAEAFESVYANNSPNIYIQSMQGLNGKLVFPSFSEILKTNTAFVKAEISFIVSPFYEPFSPHNNLILVTKNSAGNFQNILDITEGAAYYGGFYNALTGKYTFTITRFLQESVRKINTDPNFVPELYIIPEKLGLYDGNRTILLGNKNITLTLYYIN